MTDQNPKTPGGQTPLGPGWDASRGPKPRTLLIVAVVAVIAAGYLAFGNRGGDQPTPNAPATSAPVAGVPWSDYAPTVRTGIDAAAAAKDCGALQTAFDNADANNVATMTRTGHNNAALMGYIDAVMRAAGCY
jgi:hypothetical protein